MKKIKIFYLLAGIIFAAGIAGCFIVLNLPGSNIIKISQNGAAIMEIDLSKAEDRFIETEFEGRKNTIEIKDGKIRVSHADCPDKICVNTGWLSAGIPIVCLPNRLVIEFAEDKIDVAVKWMKAKKITELAMLTDVALVMFVVELQIPNPFPIPGIKLGLANIVTVYAIYHYRAREVMMVVGVRIETPINFV